MAIGGGGNIKIYTEPFEKRVTIRVGFGMSVSSSATG